MARVFLECIIKVSRYMGVDYLVDEGDVERFKRELVRAIIYRERVDAPALMELISAIKNMECKVRAID